MYYKMKKTALILAFLACFINHHGFAGGKKETKAPQEPAAVPQPKALDSIDDKINSITGELTKIEEDIIKIYGEIESLKMSKAEPGLEYPPSERAAQAGISVVQKDDNNLTGNDEKKEPPNQKNNAGNSEEPIKPAKASNSIMGGGAIRPLIVLEYVNAREKYPALDRDGIEKLINTYFIEAEREGVNADIAIAQMLYTTSNLKNRALVADCNYGGLGKIGNWDGKFPRLMRDGMTEGVIAHIQHLKAYAKEPLRGKKIDPRFDHVYDKYGSRGISLEEVCGYWSPQNSTYGKKITGILDELRKLQNVM
jgi:hypothetical protein